MQLTVEKKMKIAILVSALLMPVLAMAQASCDKLLAAIDRGERMAAYYDNGGAGDNSAVRDGLRKAKTTNQLLVVAINVQIMLAQKCKPMANPIDPDDYAYSAYMCSLEESTGKKGSPKCVTADWKRGEGQQK